MKPICTLLFVLFVMCSTAQVTVNFGGGFTNMQKPVANIEVGYQLKQMKLSTGYLVNLTDLSEVHDLFFLKAGKQIKLKEKSDLEIGSGIALHTFQQLEVSKVDQNYTYYNRVNTGKVLFYMNYQKRVISDGAFFVQAMYTGHVIYAGAGLTYFFKQKKKENKEKENKEKLN